MARAKRAAAPAYPNTAPAAEEAPLWLVGTWAGQPHYSCRRCPFSTLDLERIRSHLCELPTHAR